MLVIGLGIFKSILFAYSLSLYMVSKIAKDQGQGNNPGVAVYVAPVVQSPWYNTQEVLNCHLERQVDLQTPPHLCVCACVCWKLYSWKIKITVSPWKSLTFHSKHAQSKRKLVVSNTHGHNQEILCPNTMVCGWCWCFFSLSQAYLQNLRLCLSFSNWGI